MFTCLQYFQTPLKFKEYVVARRFHNAPYPGIKKKTVLLHLQIT